MRDYLTLGPTPVDEPCQQVGTSHFDKQAETRELRAFLHQLERLYPKGEFSIKAFPHDFGTYREVVVWFDEEIPETLELAIQVEGNTPLNWDEQALAELKER